MENCIYEFVCLKNLFLFPFFACRFGRWCFFSSARFHSRLQCITYTTYSWHQKSFETFFISIQFDAVFQLRSSSTSILCICFHRTKLHVAYSRRCTTMNSKNSVWNTHTPYCKYKSNHCICGKTDSPNRVKTEWLYDVMWPSAHDRNSSSNFSHCSVQKRKPLSFGFDCSPLPLSIQWTLYVYSTVGLSINMSRTRAFNSVVG